MEKRKYPRHNSPPITADLSDGRLFFSGNVQDLSHDGLCLSGVPQQLDHRARLISVVLTRGNKNFKMMTRACWSWQEGKTKTIGLEILKEPTGWQQFVQEQESRSTIQQ